MEGQVSSESSVWGTLLLCHDCDKDLYPNMYTLLQIACTLPVTSSECERNASMLHRLRNFMRAGMTENRLTSLALMHIHYDHEVNVDFMKLM